MTKNYTKREKKVFNKFRSFFQKLVCSWTYGLYIKTMYRIKVEGRENYGKDQKFIAVCNHISGRDPFILCDVLGRSVAFMAKKELFETFFVRWIMDWCGAFAVNRDRLDVSTIKTALSIKDTNWTLGLFPQGTRQASGKIENVTRGFASIAKATKLDILPIGILGADEKVKWPFTGKITVKIGEIIPYSENTDEMMEQWCDAVVKLTGFEYSPA